MIARSFEALVVALYFFWQLLASLVLKYTEDLKESEEFWKYLNYIFMRIKGIMEKNVSKLLIV